MGLKIASSRHKNNLISKKTFKLLSSVVGVARVFYDDSVSVCTQGDHPRVSKNPASLPLPASMKRTIDGVLRRPRPPPAGAARGGGGDGALQSQQQQQQQKEPGSYWWVALIVAGVVGLALAAAAAGLLARRQRRRGSFKRPPLASALAPSPSRRQRRSGQEGANSSARDVEAGGGGGGGGGGRGGGGRGKGGTRPRGSSLFGPGGAPATAAGTPASSSVAAATKAAVAETSLGLQAARQQQPRRQQEQLQREQEELQRGSIGGGGGSSVRTFSRPPSLSPRESPSGRLLRDEAAAALLGRAASGDADALSRSVISITRGGGRGAGSDSDRGGGGGGGGATTVDFELAASEGGSLLGASSAAFASAWQALRIGAPDVGEAVEVGPLIGRGSYGRVYKGDFPPPLFSFGRFFPLFLTAALSLTLSLVLGRKKKTPIPPLFQAAGTVRW